MFHLITQYNVVGREEAVAAGKALKAEGYTFDVAHTSVLKRAQITLNSVLKEIGQTDLPTNKTWRLNERHYGGLTGLNKAETAAKYGEAQVSNNINSPKIPFLFSTIVFEKTIAKYLLMPHFCKGLNYFNYLYA